jgi:hypothetical protein
MKYNADMLKWKRLIESISRQDEQAEDEPDHEVGMAKGQLLSAVKNATRIAKHLSKTSEEDGIDGWIASKITLASDYIENVANYMDGQSLRESSEGGDKTDTVTMDVPLILRIMEYAREEIKDDVTLHKVVEKLVELSKTKSLSMDDYESIVGETAATMTEARGEEVSSPEEAIEQAYDYLDTRHDSLDMVEIMTKDGSAFILRDSQNRNGINSMKERGWKTVIIAHKDRTLRTTKKYEYVKTEQ